VFLVANGRLRTARYASRSALLTPQRRHVKNRASFKRLGNMSPTLTSRPLDLHSGMPRNEVNDALAFQKLKNEIIASPASNSTWHVYTKARAIAKDKKWFRQPGIDIRGPEKRDDPFWTHLRRFYGYDPAPTLRASKAPLLAIFGKLDTPEGVKANVRAIKQIMDQASRHDYTIKVYPNGSHNLMESLPTIPTSSSASAASHPAYSTQCSPGPHPTRQRGQVRR
jgi:hypothetical protein